MRICLYQTEIAQNAGSIIRTCACFNLGVDLIQPIGFVMNLAKFKRSVMDYIDHCDFKVHDSFEDYKKKLNQNVRMVMTTPNCNENYYDFKFQKTDIIVFGKESTGLPDRILKNNKYQIKIPMKDGMRSLNLAISVGIIGSKAASNLKIF